MKRFAALLQVVIVLSIPSVVLSQSLADLANKEKDRRQKIGEETKVITNQDIYHGAEPAADSAAQLSEKKDSEKPDSTEKQSAKKTQPDAKNPDAEEPVDFQGRPESFWRESMADARTKVKDLENEANVLTLKLNDLQTQFYREDDGFKREGIQREIQKTIYEQDQNKENLAKAKDALQDLEKEARKSGALPGWIEQKN
jgi:hypothetical protein